MGEIMEATAAQHVRKDKTRPAQFVHNGVLCDCECRDCRSLEPLYDSRQAQGYPSKDEPK